MREHVLISVGIALILLGSLTALGYIKLEIIDTSPPNILSFPFKSKYLIPEETTDIAVFIQDIESSISTVVYTDNYTGKVTILQLSRYLPRGFINIIAKYDMDNDLDVDKDDSEYVSSRVGSVSGDNKYDPKADLNNDSKIDMKDVVLINRMYNTYLYTAKCYDYTTVVGTLNIKFKVIATNIYGYSNVFEDSVCISTEVKLKVLGKWFINDIEVQDFQNIALHTNEVTVTFKPLTGVDILNAKVYVGTESHLLTKRETGEWNANLTVYGDKQLKLVAYTYNLEYDERNLMLTTPEQGAFSISATSLLFITVGVILIISGIIIRRKENKGRFI